METTSSSIPFDDGRKRATIAAVEPEIDGGRYPIKRVVGDEVVVTATTFADGHDVVRCVLRHRAVGADDWSEQIMRPLGDDRWQAAFQVTKVGRHLYTLSAWVDRFATWLRDLRKRVDAGRFDRVDLLVGSELIREAAGRAPRDESIRLKEFAAAIGRDGERAEQANLAFDAELAALMDRHADRSRQTQLARELGGRPRCASLAKGIGHLLACRIS